MNTRTVALGSVGILLVLVLIGGAYALGRSDSGSASNEPVSAQVEPSPTSTSGPTDRATISRASPSPLPTATIEIAPTTTSTAATPTTESVRPLPTNTPPAPPTHTPSPSPTATEAVPAAPTAQTRPVYSRGVGDHELFFVDLSPGLLHITGNAGGGNFIVWGLDEYGDKNTLFVNTLEPYEGTVPINFTSLDITRKLQITATGPWTVDILPLSAARVVNAPGVIAGIGDDVVMISGTPGTARIVGNDDSRHFAVIAYGTSYDLLVNTDVPVNRKVEVPADAIYLEIQAEGNWGIQFD
jgi:hypothetical protein